ncbi:hypothetical protein FDA94_28740 [Herbidospora galbida]|uniref:Uncharacterized protein n=1 Tax=Herbidospora galbida TaxID=2575442 RepID=A0A4U3M8P1_9ACTN|nr:antirestriction protein ArdA [Herbidospora galbida]TKK84619.1 hypothetical protein FDA94_28740 [Herbidospora galbida]
MTESTTPRLHIKVTDTQDRYIGENWFDATDYYAVDEGLEEIVSEASDVLTYKTEIIGSEGFGWFADKLSGLSVEKACGIGYLIEEKGLDVVTEWHKLRGPIEYFPADAIDAERKFDAEYQGEFSSAGAFAKDYVPQQHAEMFETVPRNIVENINWEGVAESLHGHYGVTVVSRGPGQWDGVVVFRLENE